MFRFSLLRRLWRSSLLRLVFLLIAFTFLRCPLVSSNQSVWASSVELAEKAEALLAAANINDTASARHAAEKILEHALDGRSVSEVFKSGWEAQRELARLLLPASASEGVKLRLLGVLRDAGMHASPPSRSLAASEPWREPSRSKRETLLKDHLLSGKNTGLKYDFHTPPDKTQVQLGLNIFKIFGVDLKASVLTLAVWVRMFWRDSRLAFNSTLWNISSTTFGVEAHSFENTRLWVPDIELYNNEGSLSDLSLKDAMLYPDGTIIWSRPGLVKALCVFKGLESFPFDDLQCQLEFGSWAFTDNVVDVVPRRADGGATWKGEDGSGLGNGVVTSLTQGTSFQDYTLRNVLVERQVTYYDTVPGGYPVILFTVIMRRARLFYVLALVLPQIIVAALSWITYFMHPEVGERFGFVITLFLASCATDIVATEFMPVCNDMLMMNWVTMVAMAASVIAMIETAVVMFVYRLEITDLQQLLPTCLRNRLFRSRMASLSSIVPNNSTSMPPSRNPPRFGAVMPGNKSNTENTTVVQEFAWDAANGTGSQRTSDDLNSPPKDTPRRTNSSKKGRSGFKESLDAEFKGTSGQPRSVGVIDTDKIDLRLRRHLFSQAFFILDEDFSGLLEFDEVDTFGKYMLGDDWSQEMLNEFFTQAESDGVSGLSLHEFSNFCERVVSHAHGSLVESSHVQTMVTCFIEMMNREAEKNSNRWKSAALKIDTVARHFIPLIQCVLFLFILVLGSR